MKPKELDLCRAVNSILQDNAFTELSVELFEDPDDPDKEGIMCLAGMCNDVRFEENIDLDRQVLLLSLQGQEIGPHMVRDMMIGTLKNLYEDLSK